MIRRVFQRIANGEPAWTGTWKEGAADEPPKNPE